MILLRTQRRQLRKAPFKRGLERNGKNKNVLGIDAERDGGIFLGEKIRA